jgi:protein-disulfide isomerase
MFLIEYTVLFLLDYYLIHLLKTDDAKFAFNLYGTESNNMKKTSFVLAMAFALVFISQGAFADVNSDIEALKKGQAQMQKDLAEIKKLIKAIPAGRRGQARPPFKPQDLTVEGAPFLGSADAPVTIVEFTDYQCPFCKRHTKNTMGQLVKEYVDAGKVKYILREFPLVSIHPQAHKLSQAALCAGDQGKYWEMHDRFFAGKKPTPKTIDADVEALGLDGATFKECYDSGKHKKTVDKDIADGSKLGVRGTPSFFFGKTSGSNKIHATAMLRGAQGFPQFKKEIEKLLNAKADAKKGS